jgi:hypothetical protein
LKLAPSAAMPDIEAALREFVHSRAAGLCEYCRISEHSRWWNTRSIT